MLYLQVVAGQAYFTYQTPSMATVLTGNQILQPLVLQVMPTSTKPISSQLNQPSNRSEIKNNSAIDNGKRKHEGEIDAKIGKKSLVKIAPKPSVGLTVPVLNRVMPDSKNTILSGDRMVFTSSNHTLTSLRHAHTIDSNTPKDISQTTLPSVPNSRPPCPVQLSAAIALSELAAKTGDVLSSEGCNDVNDPLNSSIEFNRAEPSHLLRIDKHINVPTTRLAIEFCRLGKFCLF